MLMMWPMRMLTSLPRHLEDTSWNLTMIALSPKEMEALEIMLREVLRT